MDPIYGESNPTNDAGSYAVGAYDPLVKLKEKVAATHTLDSSGQAHSIHVQLNGSANSDANPCHLKSTFPEPQMGLDTPPLRRSELDMVYSIRGMYRILDLISEQGSDGLVQKVVISQDSLATFINNVCPSAFVSINEVNFNALDKHAIRPVGVYGSKQEIVRFLSRLRAIDETIAAQLLIDTDYHSHAFPQPNLRSGLYIVTTPENFQDSHQIFVLYWPEKTTWDDSATVSVCRNRTMFMRYLTKICDQVVSLISSDHARTFVWGEGGNDSGVDILDIEPDESGYVSTFEVAQTEKQGFVTVREGFKVPSQAISLAEAPTEGPDSTTPMPVTPFLLFGETTQGFMTVEHRQGKVIRDVFVARSVQVLQLDGFLTSDRLHINETLNEQSLNILVRSGLERRFPDACRKWKQDTAMARRASDSRAQREITSKSDVKAEQPALRKSLLEAASDEVVRLYPCFDRGAFSYSGDAIKGAPNGFRSVSELLVLYPKAKDEIDREFRAFQCINIENQEFRNAKDRIGLFKELYPLLDAKPLELDTQTSMCILEGVLEANSGQVNHRRGGDEQMKARKILNSITHSQLVNKLKDYSNLKELDEAIRRATEAAKKISDVQLLSQLSQDVERYAPHYPQFEVWAGKAVQRAFEGLEVSIQRTVKKLLPAVYRIQEQDCRAGIERESGKAPEEELSKFRLELIQHVNDMSTRTLSSHTLSIDNAEEHHKERYLSFAPSASCRIFGSRTSQQDPVAMYTVHRMNLTTQDQHELQLNPSWIPSPLFEYRHTFSLPLDHSIVRIQLLEGEKLLLVVADRVGNLNVYLDRLTAIDTAITRGRGKRLNREKIGQEFLLEYDETKKMLALVSSDKLLLHIFVFDESRGFLARGSAIDLHMWYTADGLFIRHACFVSGSEELLLVDSLAQARVFSLVTLQFRPVTLGLNSMPHSVSSTPDGACLLVGHLQGGNLALTAYRWSSFGSAGGIPLGLALKLENGPVVTSLISRTALHVILLDFEGHTCRSHALDITRKVAEFTFNEKDGRGSSARHGEGHATAHNCLIDCHAEVWTRFPVLPGVQREMISSSILRSVRKLVFVTDRDHQRYAPHFAKMISSFEKATKKLTRDVLKSTQVSAVSFTVFASEFCGDGEDSNMDQERTWRVSAYPAGEWLAGLVCLIPIQLAMVKENQFVPLKNGAYSPELEKSLFGADVNRTVDNLSFGWYESLFHSYFAFKSVKVVSSMGEQSVGKSYALDHLVDTSFAGSVIRSTEGVWMSVTFTKDTLIVALDFEGLRNPKRTAQEDALLVLFGTAISNLTLFRNSFVHDRDIARLFRPFQSSSTLLDPKTNPSLFRSKLVVVIKDVPDSDRAEITKEFSRKFQQLVQQEKTANFISRLHGGKLSIIPWPVIESEEFYKLFHVLKERLDEQVITHHSAREFLHVLKTLMAKLKLTDWCAVSQTIASHREQLMSTLIADALTFGYATLNRKREPLKNLDTDMPVDLPDTPYHLFIERNANQLVSHERMLTILRMAWKGHVSRQHTIEDEWMAGLSQHLDSIVNLRIAHVREWLDQNLSRFHTAGGAGVSHVRFEELKRRFEILAVDLRHNVQLCGATCAKCQLRCIQSRAHLGGHDCRSDHVCVHVCEFCSVVDPEEHRPCTLSAGHSGKHVCVANQHVCAEPCKFTGSHGCPNVCAKPIDHPDEEHLCALPIHFCGKPCNVSDVNLHDGSVYSCPGTCQIQSEIDHTVHQCNARSCSIQCQLCKHICAEQNHMHALDSGAIHLCGREHFCTAICASPGICCIETVPSSTDGYSGKSNTFQRCKYSQVAKRLQCIKPIPLGATKHQGPHSHTPDENVYFCETRCRTCGNFCRLPFGHVQPEHDTGHGIVMHDIWTMDRLENDHRTTERCLPSAGDPSPPILCNFCCSMKEKHLHIDHCCAVDEAACVGNEGLRHLTTKWKIHPDPDRAKDVFTHELFWKRNGFKDPHASDEKANFGNIVDCRAPIVTVDVKRPC